MLTSLPNVNRRAALIFGLTAAFAICAGLISACHEVWRDEAVPLSMVMESGSLAELTLKMRNFGHPVFWHGLLYLSYQLFPHPIVLKALNVLMASAAVAVFLRHAPFRWHQKILFIFSYYPLYQYGAINRSYALVMLLLFAIAAVYPKRFERFLLLSVLLAALINTHALGAIIALAVFVSWFIEFMHPRARRPVVGNFKLIAGAALLAASAAVFACQTAPASKSIIFHHSQLSFSKSLMAAAKSFIWPGKVFHFSLGFDNSLFAGAVAIGLGLIFWHRKPVFMIFALSLLGLEMFSRLIYPLTYSMYHQGFFVLLMMFCLWISSGLPARRPQPSLPARAAAGLEKALDPLLSVLLLLQLCFGVIEIHKEITEDFSSSKKLAALLSQPRYSDAIVISDPDFLIESLPYYTSHRLFIVRENRFGRYVQFTKDSRETLSLEELSSAALRLRDEYRVPIVVALWHKISPAGPYTLEYGYNKTFTYSAQALQEFQGRARHLADLTKGLTDEKYNVYVLE